MSNQYSLSPNPPLPPEHSVPKIPPRPDKGLAIAGLVLATVSLLASLFIFRFGFGALIVALISSVAGIVLSALGYRSLSGRTIAIIGLVVSIVVFVLLVLLILLLTPVRVERH